MLIVSVYEINKEDEQLGMLVMESLTVLLNGNANNANVLRECGGAKCAHNLVPFLDCRAQALGLLQD